MRDESKPYVCIRHGWIVQITPRNAAGWRGLGLWLLLLALPTAVFVALVSAGFSDATVIWVTVAFHVVVIAWTWAMIRWMMARSETIDIKDLEAFKREQKKSKRR